MTNTHEEMNRRIANGEFGTPPDLDLVNQECANILENVPISSMQRIEYNYWTGVIQNLNHNNITEYIISMFFCSPIECG